MVGAQRSHPRDDYNNSLKDQLVDGNITWKQAQNEVKQIVEEKGKEKVG